MKKNRVTIIGLGARGQSIAAALRPIIENIELIGHDRAPEAARRAAELKLVDKTEWNLLAACEHARLIVIAIPQSGLEQTLKALGPELDENAIVVDLCPDKAASLALARALPNTVHYISCDLVLSPAKVLPADATPGADALHGAVWTLSPRPGTSPEGVDALVGIVSQTEAHPILMPADEHDGLRLALATVPAATAFALLGALASDDAWQDRQWLAGAEFAQATVSANAGRARDLAHAMVVNAMASRHWLNQIMLQLMAMRDAVDAGDEQGLERRLAAASAAREAWLGEWRRGRLKHGEAPDIKRPSLLGAFMGESLAGKLRGDRKPG